MTVREHIDRFNHVLNPKPVLSKEEIESIRDSVSDPTGLQPFMKKRIEQSDDLQEQVEQLQAALQEQIRLAEEERALRIAADEKEHRYTVKWNRINLSVAITAALFGLGGLIVSLVNMFTT